MADAITDTDYNKVTWKYRQCVHFNSVWHYFELYTRSIMSHLTSTSERRAVISESSCESRESSTRRCLSHASSSSSMSLWAESYSTRRRRRASHSTFVCFCSDSNSWRCRLMSPMMLTSCWHLLLLSSASSAFSLTNSILLTVKYVDNRHKF